MPESLVSGASLMAFPRRLMPVLLPPQCESRGCGREAIAMVRLLPPTHAETFIQQRRCGPCIASALAGEGGLCVLTDGVDGYVTRDLLVALRRWLRAGGYRPSVSIDMNVRMRAVAEWETRSATIEPAPTFSVAIARAHSAACATGIRARVRVRDGHWETVTE